MLGTILSSGNTEIRKKTQYTKQLLYSSSSTVCHSGGAGHGGPSGAYLCSGHAVLQWKQYYWPRVLGYMLSTMTESQQNVTSIY